MRPEELIGNVVGLVIVIGFVAVLFGVLAYICYLLSDALEALPPEHRKMSPGLVWLMLIPCFGVFWNFFVFVQIPQSYDSYLRAHGRPVDSTLQTLGVIYSVLALMCMIPYLGGCFTFIALGILIFFLVKLSELKRLARELGPAPATPPWPVYPPFR